MSIQVLRDGLLTQRRNDRDASIRRRSSRLRALNAVTQALTSRVGLPHALYSDFDSTAPDPEEVALLAQHDLLKGGNYFSDSSFPISLEAVKNALANSFASVKTTSKSAQPAADDDDATILSDPVAPESTAATGREDAAHRPQSADGSTRGQDPEPTSVDTQTPVPQVDTAKQAQMENITSSPSKSAEISEVVAQLPDAIPATNLNDRSAQNPDSPVSVNAGAELTDVPPSPAAEAAKVVDDAKVLESKSEHRKEDADGDTQIPDASAAPVLDTQSTTEKSDALLPEIVPESPSNGAGVAPKESTILPVDSAPQPSAQAIEPVKSRVTSTPTVDRTQRMQTRVSSGAMRQKSVAEIMQESPRSSTKRKPTVQSTSSQSPKPTPSRALRNPMPAPPPPPKSALTLTTESLDNELMLPFDLEAYSALIGAAEDPNRDYLEPLYRIQAHDPPNGRTLGELLHKASKSISTSDQLVCYRERQDHRILKRVYGLQYANHWSLRQMEPCSEPPAPKTHWDHVIAEAKWMRTDFRQERKEKKILARFFAESCAEWVAANQEDRLHKQVRTRKPQQRKAVLEPAEAPQSPAATHFEAADIKDSADEPVPELVLSGKEDHSSPINDIESPATPQFAIVPDSIFSALNLSEANAHLLESEEFTKVINDLPLYAPFDDDDVTSSGTSNKLVTRAAPSVSKFSKDKLITKASGPSRKRSRYDYESDNDDDEPEGKRARASQNESGLTPEQTDIALFDMEHKHIKDRLRASNTFRPPSEFPMPSEKFYEWRLASQWTWEDDQKLRKLAKDYCFNWSLVSNQMALPSHFHGAADRRTPWECFERWVELETLPNDMRKTVYFRTWAQRLETAARQVDARYQAQLQLHAQNANPTPPPMKRRTMPVRVDRRRTGRYLHIVDAMRKLARKREQQQHKQAEAQKAASMRKQHEPTQTKTTVHTPQEFSRLRHERDLQQQARNERMREAMLAQQKAAQMQRAGQHPNQQALLAAQQQQRQGNPQLAQAQNAQMQGANHSQGQMGSQGQHHHGGVPMQNRNSQLGVPQMGMQGNVPQAQMQASMRSNSAGPNQMSQDQIQRMAMQAQLKGNQMQNMQQMKQYQQQMISPGGNNSMNGMMNGQLNNNQAAMLAAMQSNQNGMNNMQHHGGQMGANGTSPHMPPPNTSQPGKLSSGLVPAINQIKHSLQAAHPQATPQQIEQMANEQMKRHIQTTQARQNAVNAASGNYSNNSNQVAFQQNTNGSHGQQVNHGGQMNNFNNMNGTSSAQYSQMMRQRLMQQQQQQQQQQQSSQQQQVQGQGQNLATASASPRPQQASPANMHVSPAMQHAVPNMNSGMNMNMGANLNGQQRPPSRNTTPGMVRIPSSGGMVSPGIAQGSPRPQMVKQG
ncbi:hypothetical protein K461DRAFT_296195 [Myriangium duriaei CBS 260.36]|uniref:Vacuolar import and degradation protein 21 n=1 Tax=Myriangium duriaei CBS 260.36 TaxID=1168546 RepID=A0A9P4IVW5_9PEZI|nr:hypothetical protein K461DRAFT_296195 [Myriangium duriaei CBS 260.36]